MASVAFNVPLLLEGDMTGSLGGVLIARIVVYLFKALCEIEWVIEF